MKLFVDSNYLSPYAMSVFVALREKMLPFEIVPINLQRAEHLTPSYAEVSRTLRVPTLSDGGFSLSESSAICEYLEDGNSGTSLYPTDPELKAKAREMQAWFRSALMPIREERPTEVVFLKQSCAPLSDAARAETKKLFSAAESLLPIGAQYLFGQWSIVDTELALMLNRLIFAGDFVPDRLAQFSHFQWQRASVQEWCNMQRPVQ